MGTSVGLPGGFATSPPRIFAKSCRPMSFSIAAGTPYVKIYEKDGLHSINPEYSVIRVTDDDNVRLIGRVLGLVPEGAIAPKEETAELLEIFESDSK